MDTMIAYLGDDGMDGAAAYLAGVMMHAGIAFRHVASGSSAEGVFANAGQAVSAFVLSDYRFEDLSSEELSLLVSRVTEGAGLLMIGGWNSFSGGGYRGTEIEDLLPVKISDADDRVNWPYPCIVRQAREHPIAEGLPFNTPPVIGGYNRVTVDRDAELVLEAHRFTTIDADPPVVRVEGAPDPLLVLGTAGRGRTAALTTDAAPHWVGGLVDWGDERVSARVCGLDVEVGNWYARLFENLLRWVASS